MTESTAAQRPRALTPTRVHVASLVVGFVVLLVLGRDQWFAYDDWSILHSTYSLWASHQGHWTTIPTLLFQALRDTVGLRSYLPYLCLALLAHLAIVHLVWRIALRAGVTPWVATGFACATVLLGSGAENLFWAFQVGYMGAVAVALVVVLLVDRARLGFGLSIMAATIAVLALPFSGTALAVLLAAAVLSWVRRGFLRTVAIFAPAGIVYVGWYLLVGRVDDNGLGVHGVQWVTRAPLFLATIFGAGYGEFTGLVFLGPAVAIGLVAWLIVARKRWLGREAIAYVLILAAFVFAALSSITRGGGELSAAGSQRYVYVIVMLSLPTMELALSAVARRRREWLVAAVVAVSAVGVVNATLAVIRSSEQGVVEQTIKRQYSAAAFLIARDPTAYPPGAQPVLVGAPDVTVADIREEVAHHLVDLVPFTSADLAAVRSNLGAAAR